MTIYIIPSLIVVSVVVGFLVYRRTKERSTGIRLMFGTLAGVGAFAAVCGLFIAVLLVLLFEPWPVSLRQGPDTGYSQECFRRHLGEMNSRAVRDVYCREEWGFGGDSIYSIRFSFNTLSTAKDIVTRRQLLPQAFKDGKARYIRGPRWWPDEADLGALQLAFTRESVEYYWIDKDRQLAYYQKANF